MIAGGTTSCIDIFRHAGAGLPRVALQSGMRIHIQPAGGQDDPLGPGETLETNLAFNRGGGTAVAR